jgi:aspartyl-tRNA(Asn)/glutamyl-tRNA(Gln) amidotransferase subunit A
MRTAVDAPSLQDLIGAVRRRERTPDDLLEEALTRLDRVEPYTAAFTVVAADRARVEARALSADAAAERWRGPLHGIPVAVKDLFDVAGEVTMAGSRVPPSWHVAERDADAVARLRSAGAVVIGRTRTHEYAWGLTTQHPVLGGTRNPHDSARVPGGSSGGSAAAVASGVVALGLGTDTAGSIRLPAAWCGLVGHKPTHGRVNLRGAVPLAPSFDHAGAIVRTVPDARLALSVLIGHPLVEGHYAHDLRGLRVGRVSDELRPTPDASVRATVELATARAVEAGAVRVDVTGPDWPTMRDTFFALQASEALAYHRSLGHWPQHAGLYGDDVRSRLRRAEAVAADGVARGRRSLAAFRSHLKDVFATVDVIVQPVAGSGPSAVGAPDVVRVNGQLEDLREQVLPHTLLASLCGLPACSVPVGTDADGLPIGAQVIGPAGRDELVLDVAGRIEALSRPSR